MNKLILIVPMYFLISACSAGEDSYHQGEVYKSVIAQVNLSEADIDNVERIMRSIAVAHGLQFAEKNREVMASLNRGDPSFFIVLTLNDKALVALSNVGPSQYLNLLVSNFGDIPLTDLDVLFHDVQSRIEAELDIKFQDKSVWTSEQMRKRHRS